jgi:hypothetical protein
VPLLFALTMFVSATLLFLVQPMVGKMILPHLGGTPAVWNTCMVFYQALLLAGYYYSHKVSTNLEPTKQTRLHLWVLIAPLVAMGLGVLMSENNSPIPIAESLSPRGDAFPFFSVMAMLCVAIALPFFVVSTSAPLLQKWFAYTGHPSSKDPYFLYGASNFGSLLALVMYPAVIEPSLRIIDQNWVFGIGYAILVGLIAYCGKMVREAQAAMHASQAKKKPEATTEMTTAEGNDPDEPTMWAKLYWLGLAFVPSSLMLGVTTFMSTDIASLPLLWIIPLALYLITFIVAFSNVPKEFHLLMTLVTPVMLLLLVFLKTSNTQPKQAMILLLHMATFFCVTMTCHGQLALCRPPSKYLTNFYLIMSIGGMMGGIFNGLIAPIVFTFTTEYPLTLVIACFFLPKLTFGGPSESKFNILDLIFPMVVYLVARGLWDHGSPLNNHIWETARESVVALGLFGIVAGICCLLVADTRFQFTVVAMLGASLILFGISAPLIEWIQTQPELPWYLQRPLSLLKMALFLDSWNAQYARWIFAAMPLAAYGVYWLRIRNHDKNSLNYTIYGVVALAFAYAVALSLIEPGIKFTLDFVKLNILSERTLQQILIFGLPAMLCYFFVERPIRFGLSVGAILLANHLIYMRGSGDVLSYDRSFFGTLKVEEDETRYNIGPWVGADKILPEEIFDTYEYAEGKSRRKSIFYRKVVNESPDGTKNTRYLELHPLIRLSHGTTLHGIQRQDGMIRSIAANMWTFGAPHAFHAATSIASSGGSNHWEYPGREPLTYYHRTGPVGKMFEAFRGQPRVNDDVACIGLGTGSLSSYGKPGQRMTFFEIDSHVVKLVFDERPKDQRDKDRLARESALYKGDFEEYERLFRRQPNFFTYFNDALDQGVKLELEMGDARISLKRLAPERKFGMMLIDAFSSDSIPVHLLTKESVQLFFDRLEEDGILAMHISNRYLDLEPVVERIARELKLTARVMHDRQEEGQVGKTASTWIALTKTEAAMKPIILSSDELQSRISLLAGPPIAESWTYYWGKLRADDRVGLWTDDYSPITRILNDSFSLFGGGD